MAICIPIKFLKCQFQIICPSMKSMCLHTWCVSPHQTLWKQTDGLQYDIINVFYFCITGDPLEPPKFPCILSKWQFLSIYLGWYALWWHRVCRTILGKCQVKFVNFSFYLDDRNLKSRPGPVLTNILILRILAFLEFFLEFWSFLRIILRIRIFKFGMFWNIPKFVLFIEKFWATILIFWQLDM